MVGCIIKNSCTYMCFYVKHFVQNNCFPQFAKQKNQQRANILHHEGVKIASFLLYNSIFCRFFFRIYLFLYERILKWLIMIAISYNVILTFLSYVIYDVDSKIFNSTALFVSFRHPFKIFLQNVTFY